MLADAGIPVNVALAPVVPRIADAPESLERVIRAARDAGAQHVWHNTLYLHDVTREAFFGYLREHRPELLAEYADLYRGKYAPRAVSEEISERVKALLARFPARAVHSIVPQMPMQLSLIERLAPLHVHETAIRQE